MVVWMALRLHPTAGSAELEIRTGLSRRTVLSGTGQVMAGNRTFGGPRVKVPGALLAERAAGAQAKVLHGLLQERSLWADMREGALFIWDRRPMLWLLGTFSIVNLLTVPVVVFQPLLVKYNLGAMAFLSRMMFPLMDAHSQAIWQVQTPKELQGRVFAVRRTIAQFSGPLGSAVAGVVGGMFPPGLMVSVMSVGLAIFCLVQWFNPHLKRVEDKDWLDQLAAEANAKRLKA